MNLTPIQAQVLADISTNRPVGHEQARSAALSSLKKRGYVVLVATGKHVVALLEVLPKKDQPCSR